MYTYLIMIKQWGDNVFVAGCAKYTCGSVSTKGIHLSIITD